MNILFDLGHPAHVHLFKNFIFYLKKEGYNPIVTTRDKEITNQLLDYYGIEYLCLSEPGYKVDRFGKIGRLAGLGFELLKRDFEILKLHKKYKFKFGFGTSVSIAHLSAISDHLSYHFTENDDITIPLQTKITYPLATAIVTPDCIKYEKWNNKRILYPSYHELAYLHPNNFTPDKNILDKYGLEPQKFIIARFSAHKAHHDINAKGISEQLWGKIEPLISNYEIIKSFEAKQANKIKPWDMHHIMAFAKMVISDSQTMSIEASVLGIPAVCINTFVDQSTVVGEVVHKYNLASEFFPNQEEAILKTVRKTLDNPDQNWQQKREKLLSEKIDLNQWMINFFEKEINR